MATATEIKICGEDVYKYELKEDGTPSCAMPVRTSFTIRKFSTGGNVCFECEANFGITLPKEELIKILEFLIKD